MRNRKKQPPEIKALTAILDSMAKYLAGLIVLGGASFILSGVGFQVYDVVHASVKRHHNQQPPPTHEDR